MTPAEATTAWYVTEGDVLIGGVRVISVRREVRTRMVTISTSVQPAGVEVAGDHKVHVIKRIR